MYVIRCFLCAIILAAAALAAPPTESKTPAPADPQHPNVILITIDTTRADRMGFLGSKRGLTPNLDAVARQSVVFTHAYSQAPLTPTSHATILTGTYPQYHQVLTFPIPLGKDIPYMPEILKGQGYSTAAFVGSLALDPSWGVPGFERGFDTYNAGYSWDNYSPKTRYQTVVRRGGEVVARALPWLDNHRQGPFFLWVHLFDPHEPYDPPEPYKTRYAKALYDGAIAYADASLGKLFRQLKADGLYDGALIAVTADHGESLGAHGEDTHGIFVYDETIHVPLLIKLPANTSSGKRVEAPVELADIMPTVLQQVGIEVPKQVQGASLLELMKKGPEGDAAAEAWRDRSAYSQGDYGHIAFGWSAVQSIRTGKYLYIQAPRRELYDTDVDAKAEHNLASKSPAVADTLAARMEAFRQKTTNTQPTPKSMIDEDKANKLAALGYVAGRNGSAYTSPDNGADPKDKIAVSNTVQRVTNLIQDLRCGKSVPALRKAVTTAPDVSLLHFYLGACLMENKDYENAVPEFREAVRLNPGFTHAEMNLGRVLVTMGDWEGAAAAFEHVAKLEPHLMDAHVYLEVVYAKLDRVQDEIRECRTVLATTPEHFGGNLNLGYFLAKSGDLEGAIPWLQKAASLRPTAPSPHVILSDVYLKMGRTSDAERERAEAIRLGAIPRDQATPEPDAMPKPAPVVGPGIGPGGSE